MHAKTFAVDGERIFIGSFNFDPRSAALNTEMGVLIDSADIAAALSRALDAAETFHGAVTWTEAVEGDDPVIYDREPNTSAVRRGMVTFMSWLPVEWIF